MHVKDLAECIAQSQSLVLLVVIITINESGSATNGLQVIMFL